MEELGVEIEIEKEGDNMKSAVVWWDEFELRDEMRCFPFSIFSMFHSPAYPDQTRADYWSSQSPYSMCKCKVIKGLSHLIPSQLSGFDIFYFPKWKWNENESFLPLHSPFSMYSYQLPTIFVHYPVKHGMAWILEEIPCHLSRFYLFSIHKHDMDFG